jgi:hypothetical protein
VVMKDPDERWLDVLGGATSEDAAESSADREPAALRKAIQERIANRPSHLPTEAGFSRMLDRAKLAGLLKESSQSIHSTLIKRILQLLDPSSSDHPNTSSAPWPTSEMIAGIANALSSAAPALRGGSAGEVTLRVSDPLNVSLAWQRELTKCGIDHATVILDQGHILIHFALEKPSRDLLIGHDTPPPPGAVCTLVIESNKKD